jgi:MFS family permease
MTPQRWAALYFLAFFGANGAVFPYYALYYQQAGVDSRGIGVLVAVPTLMTLVAAPAWGGVADALRLHHRLLPVSLLATTVMTALLLNAHEFSMLLVFVVLQAFCGSPIVSLADNAVMSLLGRERHRYGRLRLWGAIGFSASAMVSGEFITRAGFAPSLAIYVSLMGLAALVAIRLPAPDLITPPALSELRGLNRDARWVAFLAALVLVGTCSAILNTFFVLYMTDLGASAAVLGLAVAVAGVSELPVFLLAPRIMLRGQARGLLTLSFVAYAVRALVVSALRSPAMGVAAQLLHGLSFSALWTASVTYAREIAPVGWGATAQAAIGSVFFGMAAGVGALVGGALYDRIGPVALFQIAAAFALTGLAIFTWQTRLAARRVRETNQR